ncbi:MAG: ATP-binding protein [Chitinophaga sp.]|uniref:ATP-binding protein n=1 Tax=Chitinophaga sp. TaxID=1869181 RepID=UPI0025C1A399|nr:ATP-binding protein [Chitinophaga sp.]MBV8254846.1 ATP-binding protein [Chitinophaga sp.]
MKVKKLHIESHKHLKDLTLNFTYPEGHELAGQPLKRVCIIGQSATGKTTILDLLQENLFLLYYTGIDINSNKTLRRYPPSSSKYPLTGSVEYEHESGPIIVNKKEAIFNGKISSESNGKSFIEDYFSRFIKLVYLGSDSINDASIRVFDQNPSDLLHNLPQNNQEWLQSSGDHQHYMFEFSESQDLHVWSSLLDDILKYRKKITQMASELISKGSMTPAELQEWLKSNPNPLIDFAKNFNPILERLNLEVDIIDTEYPVPIKPKFGRNVIPISKLSTGTKGLLLSFFPLHQLNTKDAIILVDEPERSLFPDIQVELISHYERLAPEAQLIVATHSPFIAAAFQPYERFILYFDEDGNVAVRNGQSPIGDDPNDILKNDFQVNYYNEAGQKAYRDYLALKQKMSQETDIQKKKALLLELNHLGNQYNF